MGLLLRAWVEKAVIGVEALSGYEKVPGSQVSKEGYADSLLNQELNHLYWFPWVNSQGKFYLIYRMTLVYIQLIYIS